MPDAEAGKRLDGHDEKIGDLSLAITRIATVLEEQEKRRIEDREFFRDLSKGMSSLHEKVSSMLGLEKQVQAVARELTEQKSDLKIISQQVGQQAGVIDAVGILNNKIIDSEKEIIELKTEMKEFKTWKDQVTGAAGAVGTVAKVIWTVVGSAVIAGIVFLCKIFFQDQGNGGY